MLMRQAKESEKKTKDAFEELWEDYITKTRTVKVSDDMSYIQNKNTAKKKQHHTGKDGIINYLKFVRTLTRKKVDKMFGRGKEINEPENSTI